MQRKILNKDELALLILIAAVIFGAMFRLLPPWLAGFPINDGGMFYTMIEDLQANHYSPPEFTTYNHAKIPFAYPPLGFYIGAGISDLLNLSPIEVLLWVPGMLNTLSIPAFYFLAKEVLEDKFTSAVAALIYALIPHLTSWLSMGGGLTRSLGMFFMLYTLGWSYRAFKNHDRRSIIFAILAGGLTTLSHTESPIYAVAIALLIWIMKARSTKTLQSGLLIGLGVFMIASPWYGYVIYKHGWSPFQSILQTGAHSFLSVFKIINFDIVTEEPYLDILGSLGLLGIAFLILRKDYFLPLMLPVIYAAQPRSAHVIANIPLAMAGGYFITTVLLPALLNDLPARKKPTTLFIIFGIFVFINSLYFAITLSKWSLSESERNAMQWVSENTSPNEKFLVITGEETAYCDAVSEWFPALTNRKNLTTVQGSEWLAGEQFVENTMHIASFQACTHSKIDCIAQGINNFEVYPKYIYISIQPPTKNCKATDLHDKNQNIIFSLENAEQYVLVHQSESTLIFQTK